MKRNKLRELLKATKPSVGTRVHSSWPSVVEAIGHLPKRGERAVIGKLLFKVLRADSRRIHMLQLTLLPGPAGARSDQLDNAL